MPKHSFAVAAGYDYDELPPVPLAYRKFLKKPADGFYPYQMPVRIGDHCNGEKKDVPFHDDIFVTAIRRFASAINAAQKTPYQIYLYIPQHAKPADRTLIVFGHNEALTAQSVSAIKTIFYAYQNDELDLIDTAALTHETLQTTKDRQRQEMRLTIVPSPASLSADNLKNLYLQGADIETATLKKGAASLIVFKEGLSVRLFEGNRKTSYQKLKTFLQNELKVEVSLSNHEHCVNIKGAQEKVDIAYHIGKRAAPLINNGKLLSQAWLEGACRDATDLVGRKKSGILWACLADIPKNAPSH